MAIGAFAALRQTNIKRLLAYSSIGHAGYALVGLSAAGVNGFTAEGVGSVLAYMAIYFAMTIGTFGIVLGLRRGGEQLEEIDDLAGLGKTQPKAALIMAALMFAMAGVPPLAGFFGKLTVFMAAVHAGLYPLAIIGVLLSGVAAYYYIRIIKIMYFDEPHGAHDSFTERALQLVMIVVAIFLIGFALTPATVIESAGKAAQSLLG
jgi:NADH-quinone oxidoreductase subunit N